MAKALIESIFYSAVNTSLLGHILSSLAPLLLRRDSFFPPTPPLFFHLYAENVNPPFCLAVAFLSIAVRIVCGCVGWCGGAEMSWDTGHMMPAADLLTPNERAVSIDGKRPWGQWPTAACLPATVAPPITERMCQSMYVCVELFPNVKDSDVCSMNQFYPKLKRIF